MTTNKLIGLIIIFSIFVVFVYYLMFIKSKDVYPEVMIKKADNIDLNIIYE